MIQDQQRPNDPQQHNNVEIVINHDTELRNVPLNEDAGNDNAPSVEQGAKPLPSNEKLTLYHMCVLFSACIGWLFDAFDILVFNYAAPLCVPYLLDIKDPIEAKEQTAFWSGFFSSLLLVGWAVGGIGFGFLTDRLGRSKTMIITILTYSICTGAGAFAFNIYMLAALRFLSALGVGGEYSAGTTLVAESMPERFRVVGGVILYCAGPVGTFLAFGVYQIFGVVFLEQLNNSYGLAWRLIFASAMIPAILSLIMRITIKEPEKWSAATSNNNTSNNGSNNNTVQENQSSNNENNNEKNNENSNENEYNQVAASTPAAENDKRLENTTAIALSIQDSDSIELNAAAAATSSSNAATASASNSTTNPVIREEKSIRVLFRKDLIKSTIAALVIVVSALISWYCITSFISPVGQFLAAAETSDPVLQKRLMDQYIVISSVCFNIGGFLGSLLVLVFNKFFSRLNVFRIYFLLGALFIAITFAPIPGIPNYIRLAMFGPMGLFVYGIFAIFPFYLPEIFPTNVRGLGIGFSYNSGRLITAIFPFLIGWLAKQKLNLMLCILPLSIVSMFGFVFLFFRLAKETKHIEDLDEIK